VRRENSLACRHRLERGLVHAFLALAATHFVLSAAGPDELLRQVRAAEAVDPKGRQWPRTKRSDDATAVYLQR
jgi:hypothetical protein